MIQLHFHFAISSVRAMVQADHLRIGFDSRTTQHDNDGRIKNTRNSEATQSDCYDLKGTEFHFILDRWNAQQSVPILNILAVVRLLQRH